MSAPGTNIDKQKRRHRGPLLGMAAVLLFAVLLIVFWMLGQSATADNPQGNNAPIDGASETPAPAKADPPPPAPPRGPVRSA